MSIKHRPIPLLPTFHPVKSIEGLIIRSYPVGRKSFSRTCQGDIFRLTITLNDSISDVIQFKLVTTINSDKNNKWITIPFVNVDSHTYTCQIIPKHNGLHSFRVEFSLDNGVTWLMDNVPDAWVLIDPPQVDGLLIYTMIPTISGTLDDWKLDLNRIKEMGFNALHLLPITALDSSESPYSAYDFFDIDKSYLVNKSSLDSLEQLGDFVEVAKKLGIKLCFDLVLNHVGVNSRMCKQSPHWIIPDTTNNDGLKRARYWSNNNWYIWEDLVLINYEHPSEAIRSQIWSYMTEYALFWANYASQTGGFVRFDNLHSSNPEFVQNLTNALYAEYPNVGILAEYFTDETTLLHTGPMWRLNLNLATPWDYKFVPQLREYLYYIHRVSKHIRYFMPVTSHDSGAPAQEFGSIQSIIPRYIAAALLGTGATGIIQGVEYGEAEKLNFIGRKEKKIFPKLAIFAPFISKVNAILTKYTAFRKGDNCIFVDGNHESIIAVYRKDLWGQSSGFLVICNFDIFNSHQINIDISSILSSDFSYSCCDLLNDQSVEFMQQMTFNINSCDAKVLMFVKSN